MTQAQKIALAQWFTEQQIRVYFGARSVGEAQQVINMMRNMKPGERTRFKAELAKVMKS